MLDRLFFPGCSLAQLYTDRVCQYMLPVGVFSLPSILVQSSILIADAVSTCSTIATTLYYGYQCAARFLFPSVRQCGTGHVMRDGNTAPGWGSYLGGGGVLH